MATEFSNFHLRLPPHPPTPPTPHSGHSVLSTWVVTGDSFFVIRSGTAAVVREEEDNEEEARTAFRRPRVGGADGVFFKSWKVKKLGGIAVK